MTNKRIIISLCDYTGLFTEPWRDAGYEALHIDPQRENNGTILEMMPEIGAAVRSGMVAFVAGFPPCTDVSVAGARHFKKKRKADMHFQAKAALVAEQCRMIGNLSGAPWFFENPRSVFSSIFGPPNYKFNPCDYGGYLPDDDAHPEWPDILPPRDAYKKDTWLWSGNGFAMPQKQPIDPVSSDYPGWSKLPYSLNSQHKAITSNSISTPQSSSKSHK